MIPKLCKYSNPERQSDQICEPIEHNNTPTLKYFLDHCAIKVFRVLKNGSFQISLISWHQKSQCGKSCACTNHFDDVGMTQEAGTIQLKVKLYLSKLISWRNIEGFPLTSFITVSSSFHLHENTIPKDPPSGEVNNC